MMSLAHKVPLFTLCVGLLCQLSGWAQDPEDSNLFPDTEQGDQAGKPLPSRQITIVRDGPSWYFDFFAEQTKKDLIELAKGNYELTINDLNGMDDLSKVESSIDEALDDPDIDLVLAAGYYATEYSLRLPDEKRKRPVLGGAVQFSDLLENAISAEGTSKIPNYAFITNPQRLTADLKSIRSLTSDRAVYVLVDHRFRNAADQEDINTIRKRLEEQTGVSPRLVPVGNSLDSILSAIPKAANSVYISVLPRLAPPARKKVFDALANRGLFTFSMIGVADVERGAIAGQSPDNSKAIAKRAALNAHQILLGIDPRSLPVYLPVEDHLTINISAGERAGWYPNYEVLLTANLINEPGHQGAEKLTLEKAMKLAKEGNADVAIQREQEVIAQEDYQEAKSFQRPTVDVNVQQSYTDFSDRINPAATPDRLDAGSYGLELRQSLFNDSIRSNVASALENIGAEKLNTRSEELDAMEQAGIAFLNYLSANALLEIQRENLRLTENNLQLARLRFDIGSAERSETYRWEQDVAASRATVFQLEADREDARIAMNRILGQPRNKYWNFTDIELGNDDSYFMDNVLSRHLDSFRDVERYGEFLMKTAVPASPELAAFDYGLVAQGIQLARVERSFFLPTISAVLGLDRTAQGTESFSYRSQGETSAGISVSYPLYQGGFRKAEFAGQKALVRQVEAQRERALQIIEERALNSLNGVTSAHPNIRLSRVGLEAAEKNYEAVRDKYSEGAVTILDLLDAQSALLQQRQQAASAVYSFLAEIVSMQRSVAWFEFEKTTSEKQQWEKMLSTYMKRRVLEIPSVVQPDEYAPLTRLTAEQAVEEAQNKLAKPRFRKNDRPAKPVVRAVAVEDEPSPSSSGKKPGGLLNKLFQKKSE